MGSFFSKIPYFLLKIFNNREFLTNRYKGCRMRWFMAPWTPERSAQLRRDLWVSISLPGKRCENSSTNLWVFIPIGNTTIASFVEHTAAPIWILIIFFEGFFNNIFSKKYTEYFWWENYPIFIKKLIFFMEKYMYYYMKIVPPPGNTSVAKTSSSVPKHKGACNELLPGARQSRFIETFDLGAAASPSPSAESSL